MTQLSFVHSSVREPLVAAYFCRRLQTEKRSTKSYVERGNKTIKKVMKDDKDGEEGDEQQFPK